jgi:hypothetical protein
MCRRAHKARRALALTQSRRPSRLTASDPAADTWNVAF